MTSRWWAVGTLIALAVSAVVIVILRVPLTMPSAPRADQLAALENLPSDAVEQARSFRSELRPGSYGAMVIGLVVALVLGLTPLGARLVDLVSRPFGGHWIAQTLLGGLAVVFVGEVITLPISAWQHTISRKYGLSTQDWGAWTVDVLKSYGLTAVIGAVALGGFFALARWAPSWWWAPVSAGTAVLVVFGSFVYPVLIEPVFNTFTVMEDGALRDDLMALADRDGVPVSDVLVADASRRTRSVNAYVSGIGPTRRIVVYDTLLTEASQEEIVSVVAHELGHAKESDVAVGTALGAIGAAAGMILLYLVGSWTWLLRRAGVDSLANPQAIALIVALLTVAALLVSPVENAISRRLEGRADTHALELTNDPEVFQTMQGRLATVNLFGS